MNKFSQAEIVLWNKPENYGVVLSQSDEGVFVELGDGSKLLIPESELQRVGPEAGDITIKLHVASVTEHGAGGGHEAKLFVSAEDKEPYVCLHIHTKEKQIELGYYEMTLRKVE